MEKLNEIMIEEIDSQKYEDIKSNQYSRILHEETNFNVIEAYNGEFKMGCPSFLFAVQFNQNYFLLKDLNYRDEQCGTKVTDLGILSINSYTLDTFIFDFVNKIVTHKGNSFKFNEFCLSNVNNAPPPL